MVAGHLPREWTVALHEPTCTVCGCVLTTRQRLMGDLCGDLRCRDARLNQQLDAHRREAAAAVGEREPASFRLLVIPATDRRLASQPASRIRTFRLHLAAVVREAFRRRRDERAEVARPDDAEADACPPLPSADGAILARICAACEGYCCSHGGTHAFLDDDRLLRHLREHPTHRPRDVMRAYLSYLPAEAYNDACVYQGAAGCTLPHAMRADICNDYECPGLRAMRRHLVDHPDAADPSRRRCCAVARRDHVIERSAFIDDAGVRRYDPPT